MISCIIDPTFDVLTAVRKDAVNHFINLGIGNNICNVN